MAKYKILWMENVVTSTGKTKANATLIDEKGIQQDKVTIWADFPGFQNLRPEGEVEGNIVVSTKGKFTNVALYPVTTAPAWATGGNASLTKGAFTPRSATAAIARKEENIGKTMDRKEEGIKVSSTMRDAIQIVCAFYPDRIGSIVSGDLEPYLKSKIEEWRKWLWLHWDDNQPPFE